MRKTLILLCFHFISTVLFSQKITSKMISYDSISRILIKDHYNDNFERVWGREYEIQISNDSIPLFQTKEYYQKYVFDIDDLKYSKLKFLQQKGIDSITTIQILQQINSNNNQSKYQNFLDSLRFGTSKILDNWNEYKFIQNIDREKIESVIAKIDIKSARPFKYLPSIGKDSTWLSRNNKRLINKWLEGKDYLKDYQKTYAQHRLINYKEFFNAFLSISFNFNFNSYPTFEIQLITNGNDTIRINSEGQGYYQIPWNVNDQYKTYNPSFAIELAKILPHDDKFSSKKRLMPEWLKLEELILDRLKIVPRDIDKRKWKKIHRKEKKLSIKNHQNSNLSLG